MNMQFKRLINTLYITGYKPQVQTQNMFVNSGCYIQLKHKLTSLRVSLNVCNNIYLISSATVSLTTFFLYDPLTFTFLMFLAIQITVRRSMGRS